jgi:hypothetical protein
MWKKYFKVANSSGQLSPLSGSGAQGLPGYGRNDSRDTGSGHGRPCGTGLGPALIGEIGVVPAGEEIFEVPGALTMA